MWSGAVQPSFDIIMKNKVGLTLKKYNTLWFYDLSTEDKPEPSEKRGLTSSCPYWPKVKSEICPDENTYIIKHAPNPHTASTSSLFSVLLLEEIVLFWESWPEHPKGNSPVTSLHMSKSSIKAPNVQGVYWHQISMLSRCGAAPTQQYSIPEKLLLSLSIVSKLYNTNGAKKDFERVHAEA